MSHPEKKNLLSDFEDLLRLVLMLYTKKDNFILTAGHFGLVFFSGQSFLRTFL